MSKIEVNGENFQKQQAITAVINQHLKTIEDETGCYSIPGLRLRHPSFLALVDMGDIIVNYLFYLIFEYGSSNTVLMILEKIVKDKPVIPKEHRGKFYHQTVDWTTWYLTSEYYKNNDTYFNLVK